MDIRDRVGLKQRAAQLLANASYDPKKLTLLHGAVIIGFSLVISLLSVLLSHGIDSTGGLGGIGTRNLLETIQSILQLAYSLLLPFWQVGIVFAFLCVIRQQTVGVHSLLRGFRRFGPVLRLILTEGVLFFLLAMACAYVSSFLAMGFSTKLYTLMEPIAMAMTQDPNVDPYTLIAQIPMEQLLQAMTPMLLVFAVLYLVVMIFLGYRLRFANYLVLDENGLGAFAAIGKSFQLTKGNCMALFRLDLSFWLYYLLQVLVSVIAYLDTLLTLIGIGLPVDAQWSSLIVYCIYGVCVLALDYCMRPQIEATYALAYESLKNPPPVVMEEN